MFRMGCGCDVDVMDGFWMFRMGCGRCGCDVDVVEMSRTGSECSGEVRDRWGRSGCDADAMDSMRM